MPGYYTDKRIVATVELPKDEAGNIKINVAAQDLKPIEIGMHKVIEQKLSGYSLGAGSSINIDIEVPTGKTAIALIVKASYDANASAGIKIYVYWSPDGTNYDTDTDEIYDHPFEAGATKQKTYIIHAILPYVRIRIENLDATYTVTLNIWITYA